jgi:hypothetical protein
MRRSEIDCRFKGGDGGGDGGECQFLTYNENVTDEREQVGMEVTAAAVMEEGVTECLSWVPLIPNSAISLSDSICHASCVRATGKAKDKDNTNARTIFLTRSS